MSSARARAVARGQLPDVVEQLADELVHNDGIDKVSARWYALGCLHTADAMYAVGKRDDPHEDALAYLEHLVAGERRRGGRS